MAKSQTDAAHLIRSRRIVLGLSQARLAEMVGCTPTAIRRWERGELEPPDDVITDLAEALEIDAAELRPPPPPTPATVVVSSPLTPPPPPKADPPPGPSSPSPGGVTARPPARAPVPTVGAGQGVEDAGEPWIHFASEPAGGSDAAEPARSAATSTGTPVLAAPSPPLPPPPQAAPQPQPQARPIEPPVPGPDDTTVVPPPRRPVALLQRQAPAPVVTRSYLDKPSERIIYTIRLVVTVVALAIMAWLLVWALGELVGAVGEALDFFSETTLVDTGINLPPPPGATG